METQKKIVVILAAVSAVLAIAATVLLITTIYHRGGELEIDDGFGSAAITDAATGAEAKTATETVPPDTAVSVTDPEVTPQTTADPPSPKIPDAEIGVFFTPVDEQVTAKQGVNLRSAMDQGGGENIVCILSNGEVARRTGIGDNGWSRLEYGGRTLYCVSSYLTTDLSYVPPVPETSPFNTKFTPVNERVTAKELTNLRDMPSVMEPSKVIFELHHGEIATRTGIAGEGWSRVEYGDQVLYCVSSYLEVVED